MSVINPFVLEFGVKPPEYIDRISEINDIVEDFSSPYPSTHMYALLGPRGCGKTVLLNDISARMSEKEGWISLLLNCKDDLLLQLAASLDSKIHSAFPKISAEFSFSFSFLSVSLKGKEHVSDIHSLLRKMFETLSKNGMKVLIAIDDIAVNEYVEIFAKEFQILRGLQMPIYLVTTGLYSVFHRLEGQEGLAFLLRTPKIYLRPLSEKAIAATYCVVLKIRREKAVELAALTKGFAYAYQCLGYLLVKNGKKDADELILAKLDYYLEQSVYTKLWDELSQKEKEIVQFVAKKDRITNQDLINARLVDDNTISTYKKGLIQKGILSAPQRGVLVMALPRFKEFLSEGQF